MGPKATGEEWIRMRKETYDVYRQKFSPSQIGNLLESDFHHFLTSKGNMSWTNLQRGCKKATDQMGKLKDNLIYLQNEVVPIGERLNAVMRGGNLYIKGFGLNLTWPSQNQTGSLKSKKLRFPKLLWNAHE